MSSQTPPNPWFNQINYNPDFFSNSSSTGITLGYLNANYLKITAGSNPISSSTTTTFSGQLIATNDPNSIISISNKVLMSPIGTGVIYLVGVSSSAGGNYNLITDSLSHLSFACGTNSLNVGISGGANGNMNLYGSGAVLSCPTATGIAINVPNGTINALVLQATNGVNLSGSNPIINTTNAASPLNISTMTAGSGTIEFYPQNIHALSITPTTINAIVNITLPTLGVVPTSAQLGFFASTNAPLVNIGSGGVRVISTYSSLAAGTYILNGSCSYTCTTLGTITQIGCGFSTSGVFASSGQFWLSNNISLATQSFVVNSAISYMNSTCTLTLTTPTTFYFISTWIGASGAFSMGGSSSYTRIA